MSLSDSNNVQDEKREHHNHTPIDQDDIEEQERAHFQKVINALRFYRYEIIGVQFCLGSKLEIASSEVLGQVLTTTLEGGAVLLR